MEDEKIRQIIADTAAATVRQLKEEGLLQPQYKTPYERTETMLWQYNELKKSQDPQAKKIAAEIDACLAAAENDPYVDVIRLFYFAGLKNAACAKVMCCDDRTARRNRVKLVKQFSARLCADDFARTLLL